MEKEIKEYQEAIRNFSKVVIEALAETQNAQRRLLTTLQELKDKDIETAKEEMIEGEIEQELLG